jgi:prepilin-type N-terminal cleavage/methylation domain-containing protein
MKAFTITELLVVICIIGVLSLIAIPAFRMFAPNLELSGTARELVSNLRYSQQLSVTEQVEHGIRISTTTREYQLLKYGSPEEIIETKELPENLDFQEVSGFTNNEVRYNPYGAVKEEGSISLVNNKGTILVIEVRPSGFVKIKKGD